uniref:PH domain-containing protein n=1 Tax=Gopherus agassizii TaxID=38772 RepID=A0A452IPT8_9SAUR
RHNTLHTAQRALARASSSFPVRCREGPALTSSFGSLALQQQVAALGERLRRCCPGSGSRGGSPRSLPSLPARGGARAAGADGKSRAGRRREDEPRHEDPPRGARRGSARGAAEPRLGTKEGYLVKQGKIVKNWKMRWFTLHRNELKYFKDQMSTEPIRALDLTECSAVQFDYSQERVNCFCLVFPLRTYYLCAKTGIEADEWIKILRWKLSQIRKQQDQRDATSTP